MAVNLETPITTAAIPEKVFNEIWLAEMSISAMHPEQCRITARLVPARTLQDGSKELDWQHCQCIEVDNLWDNASQSELDLATALVQAVKTRAGL